MIPGICLNILYTVLKVNPRDFIVLLLFYWFKILFEPAIKDGIGLNNNFRKFISFMFFAVMQEHQQVVVTFKKNPDQGWVNGEFPFSYPVKHAFEPMGEPFNSDKIKHPRSSLNRVHCTEHGVY